MRLKNSNLPVYLSIVTAASFLLADMTNLLLGTRFEASASLLPKEHPVTLQPSVNSSGEQTGAIIIEGNIFNSKLRGKKEEIRVSAPAAEPVPDLKARFRLIGTSAGDPELSFAIIEDQTTREQTLYHLNDPLLKQVRIAQIKRNSIRLVYAGGSETLHLQLDEEKPPQPAGLSPMLPPDGPPGRINGPGGNPQGIRQLSSNRWVLDRQEVTHHLDNLNQLLAQARVIPNFSDGKPDGFRVFAIVPDSFYEKIGLQNGDVLERVNGIEIKDPESFLKVFQHLKDENRVSLDLVRNSRKETMSYEIR